MYKYFQIKKDETHMEEISKFVNEYIIIFIENPDDKWILMNIKEYNDEFMYCDRCGRKINEDDTGWILFNGVIPICSKCQ